MDTYIGFVLDTEPLKSLLHETLDQLFPISITSYSASLLFRVAP
jgi:hypothetical protein